MRANDLAMMAPTLDSFKHVTACSRDEPLPQFLPPTMTSPGWTSLAKRGSRSSSAYCAVSDGLLMVYVYLPGKITSVLTLSPYFHTRPLMMGIMLTSFLYVRRTPQAPAA